MRSAWVLTRRRAKPREQPGREVAFGGMDTFPISMRVPLEQTQGELRGLNVFVVHGHSARWREEVARFVQRIGPDLEVVILKEQPNIGRTLIRKFEDHAAGVAFAVVIATSDDVGAVATALPDSASRSEEIFDVLEPRARQNVVFELGYFFGLIGRSRTVVLLEQGTTEPSDIDGILYIPLDEDGAWKAELGREMKTAGVSVDLNQLA